MNVIKNNPCLVVLLGVYIYIFVLLASYDQVWMLPEAFRIKSFVLENGGALKISDLKEGLNCAVFENAPRLRRPLSSYFEILDTKFRFFLWHFMFPHPSLSLTWFFSLILSPILLFRFLRNIDVPGNTALGAVSLYLMSPGLLSVVVMLFRPAKAMANFSIILCLYLASCLYKSFDRDTAQEFFKKYVGLLVVMFLSFFWDETAVLIYLLLPLFFPFLLKDRKRLAVYALLPVLAYFCYFYFLPWAVIATGNGHPTTSFGLFPKHETVFAALVLRYARAFTINSGLLIFDSLGLIIPSFNAPFWAIVILGVNAVVIFAAAVYVFYQTASKKVRGSRPLWPLSTRCAS